MGFGQGSHHHHDHEMNQLNSNAEAQKKNDIDSLLHLVRAHQRHHQEHAHEDTSAGAIHRCKTMLSKLRKLIPKLMRPIATVPSDIATLMLKNMCEILDLLLKGEACPHSMLLFQSDSKNSGASSYPTVATILFYMISFLTNPSLRDAREKVMHVTVNLALLLQQSDVHGFIHVFRDTVLALEDCFLLEKHFLSENMDRSGSRISISCYLSLAMHLYQDCDPPLGSRGDPCFCGCFPYDDPHGRLSRENELKKLLPSITLSSLNSIVALRNSLSQLMYLILLESGALISSDMKFVELVDLLAQILDSNRKLQQRQEGMESSDTLEVVPLEKITMKLVGVVLKNCRNLSHLFSKLSVSFLKHLLSIVQKSSNFDHYKTTLLEVYEGVIQQSVLQSDLLWSILQEIIEHIHLTEGNSGIFLPLLKITGHYIRNADYSKVLPVLVELLSGIRIWIMKSKKLQNEIMKNVYWLFSDRVFFKIFCQTFAKTLTNRSIRFNSIPSTVVASCSPSERKRKRPRTSRGKNEFSTWYIDDVREDPYEKLSDWFASFLFPLTNLEKQHECIGMAIVIRAFFPFRKLWLSVLRTEIHSITRILFEAIEKRILPQLNESPVSSTLLDLLMCLFVHLDDWELKKYGHYFKEKVIYIDPVQLYGCGDVDPVSKTKVFEWDWRSFARFSLFLIEDKKIVLEATREEIFQRVNSSTDFLDLYSSQELFFKVIFFVNFLWVRAKSLHLNNDSWSQSFPMQVALKAYVETDCESVNCASISLSPFLAFILVKCEIASPQESARLLLDQLHNAWRNLTGVSSLNLRLAVLSSYGAMLCALGATQNSKLFTVLCNVQSITHHFPRQHFCTCSKSEVKAVKSEDKVPLIPQLSISEMNWLLDLHNLSLYPSEEYRVELVSVITTLFRHGTMDLSDPLVWEYLWFLMEGISSTICGVRNIMSHNIGALVNACHANQQSFILVENENVERLKSTFSDAVKKAVKSVEANFLPSVLATFGSLACALNFQDENEADFILWILCYLVGLWNKYWVSEIAVFSFEQINRILSWHRVSWRYLCVEYPDQTYFPLVNQLLSVSPNRSNGGLPLFLDVFVQNKVDVRTFLLASAPFVLPQYILHQNETKLRMFVAKCNENLLSGREDASSKPVQLAELMLNHIEFILKEMIMHQVQVDDAGAANNANRIAEWEFLFKFMPENSTIRDVMSHSPLRLLNLLAWELGGKRSRQAKRALKEISQYLQQESGDTGGLNDLSSDVSSDFMMPRQYFLALMTELGNRISSKSGSSSKSLSYKVRATKSIHHLLLLLRSSSSQQDPAIGIGLVDAFVPKVMATLKIGLTERKLQRYAIQAWDTFVRMLSNKALESSFVSIVVSILPCLGYSAKHILQEVDDKVTSANLSWNIDILASRVEHHESNGDESDREELNAVESTASELLKYLYLEKRIELKHAFPRIQLLPSTPLLDPIYVVLVQETGDPLHKPLHSYLSDIVIYVNHWDLGVREIALAQLFKCLVTRSSELNELMMESGDEDLFVNRVIAELLFSLLQLARTESNPALKEICARCLGALGAIDAARMPLSMFYSSSTPTINRSDSRIEYSTKDLACTLVETWLVKELRAAPQNTDSVAFAIQELLRFLADLTADPQNGGQNALNDSPYYQSSKNGDKQKTKPMPEWMKRRFERKDVLQFVEPYWSTNYTVSSDSSKRKSVSSSSALSSLSKDDGMLCDIDDDTTFYENYTSTYEEWLLSWTKRLIQISQLPERKIFLACRIALPTCPQIAVFLLPYLIQNVLRSGRPQVYTELKREIMAVLNDRDHYVGMSLGEIVIPVASASHVSESSSTGAVKRDSGEELKERAYGEYLSRHHQCSQTIFSTLDQLNEWIWSDEKKKLALHSSSNRTGMTPSGASMDMEDQEKENLEEFLKDIPTRSLSNAAYNIRAHARAIQYFEIFLRQQNYSTSKSDKKNLNTSSTKEEADEIMSGPVHLGLIAQNATYLQQLYSSVDETDALTGLATLRRVWEVSSMNERVANKRTSKRMVITQLMHRIVDHEQLAQWEDALACYEQAIQEVQSFHRSFIQSSCDEPNMNYEMQQDEEESFIDPQLELEVNPLTLKPNLYSGSIQCLIQLGRLESALQQIHGIVTQEPNFASSLYPYALECSWRLSRWDLLSDLLSSDKQNSFLLQNAVNRLDDMDSSASLERCHTGILKSNWDVSQLMLVRVLQSMHEIQTSNFQKHLHDARLEIMGPLAAASVESYQRVYPLLHKLHFLHEAEQGYLAISRGKLEKVDPKQIWKEQSCWEPRYQLMATSLKFRDPILALRRVMYQEANLYQEVAKNWLQYAKLARKQGYIRTATSAAMQAEALGNQYATLEKAKLLVSQRKMYDALQLLEPVARDVRDLELSNNTENARFAAKNLLLTTNWIQASGQRQGKKVIERYQAVIRYDPKWEKGYFFLAKYYEFLLTSASDANGTSASATASKSDERGLVIDDNFHTHLINVMRNYVLSLSFGTKFLFQSLPRLLTLWFEYGELLYLAKGNSRSMPMSMGSSGGMSTSREQQVLADITQVMLEATKRLPAYEWLVCFPQVASRICHPNPAVVEGVKNIMIRVLLCYPAQALWPILGLARSLNAQRRNRAREVISTAQRELVSNHQQEISNSFTEGLRMAEELISLAAHDSLNQRRIHVRLSRIRTKILVPIQAALTTKLPPNGLAPRDDKHDAFSSSFAGLYIKAFSDKADVMPTKEKPKRIEVLGSDGRMYAFLCKREKTGDLRKDARMMEFNTMINKLLQKDEEGRKRKLRLRTYAVVCLNEESGLMEWVRDTRAMRQLICQIHKTEKGLIQPVRITHEIKEMFLKMQKKYADNVPMMALYYRKKFLSLPMFTPRFHQWFLNNFADPTAWFESRLCFARSAAVWSMVGHIIGLGDRHGENILIDSTNGECVHVDFDCLFDKGLKLAKPEIVPFRLTPNMIDAFGITGYEGVYRRVCEVTLNLLRENKETLRSVLESFIHDPLVEWGRKGKAGGAGTNTSDLANERSKEETRIILKTIDDRLRGIYNLGDAIRPHVSSSHRSILPENETLPLSVQGQVDKLIQEAVSHENLAQMYIGWMPFL